MASSGVEGRDSVHTYISSWVCVWQCFLRESRRRERPPGRGKKRQKRWRVGSGRRWSCSSPLVSSPSLASTALSFASSFCLLSFLPIIDKTSKQQYRRSTYSSRYSTSFASISIYIDRFYTTAVILLDTTHRYIAIWEAAHQPFLHLLPSSQSPFSSSLLFISPAYTYIYRWHIRARDLPFSPRSSSTKSDGGDGSKKKK